MSEKWFEVFRAGTYPQGTFGNEDLDAIVRNHAADGYTAPLVLGHPKTDDPAYGWVDRIRRVGDKLLVTFREVADGLQELVNQGRWKNVSVRLRHTKQGWQLRHVGLLGAAPPAVEGLKPIHFEADNMDLEFHAEERRMNEEDKLKQRIAELEAEKQSAEERAKTAEAQFAAAENQRRIVEIKGFVEEQIKEGRLTPAQRDRGMVDFLAALDPATTVDFAGSKQTPANWMRDFLQSLPRQVTRGTIAGRDTDPGVGAGGHTEDFAEYRDDQVDQERLARHQRATAYAQAHKVPYEQAIRLV